MCIKYLTLSPAHAKFVYRSYTIIPEEASCMYMC